VGAAVVSGVDAPPIFEPSEHIFDFVALFVEDGVIRDGDLPVGFRGDAGGDPALGESGVFRDGAYASGLFPDDARTGALPPAATAGARRFGLRWSRCRSVGRDVGLCHCKRSDGQLGAGRPLLDLNLRLSDW
jgi:hypothetical protein